MTAHHEKRVRNDFRAWWIGMLSWWLVVAGCAGSAGSVGAEPGATPDAGGALEPPGFSEIRESDLRRDLFWLAGDGMRGREAGTIDELRATTWLGEAGLSLGLAPAGEDGTMYQWFAMRRVRQADASVVAIGGEGVALWRDAALASAVETTVDVPIVWVGDVSEASLAGLDLRGKAAAARLESARPPMPGLSLWEWRYTSAAVRSLSRALLARGAAAVVLVADSVAAVAFDVYAGFGKRGSYRAEDGRPAERVGGAPTLLVRPNLEPLLRRGGARLEADLRIDTFTYPSANVIGVIRGTDPALANEYVVFSGHQDHDGVGFAVAGDSIWNGADDNATTSVALLAIARAFKARPGRRSALFIWHGAEERGLIGSRWHVQHPVVPLDRIVAVLNGDMLGRNARDTAALLGVIPPHRVSADLARMALEANRRHIGFAVDSSWDRSDHLERWWSRSDHLPYAQEDIPSLFFTTLLHPDYHTPADNPESIDVDKLTRMTRWMYATGWAAAVRTERPAVDARAGGPGGRQGGQR